MRTGAGPSASNHRQQRVPAGPAASRHRVQASSGKSACAAESATRVRTPPGHDVTSALSRGRVAGKACPRPASTERTDVVCRVPEAACLPGPPLPFLLVWCGFSASRWSRQCHAGRCRNRIAGRGFLRERLSARRRASVRFRRRPRRCGTERPLAWTASTVQDCPTRREQHRAGCRTRWSRSRRSRRAGRPIPQVGEEQEEPRRLVAGRVTTLTVSDLRPCDQASSSRLRVDGPHRQLRGEGHAMCRDAEVC